MNDGCRNHPLAHRALGTVLPAFVLSVLTLPVGLAWGHVCGDGVISSDANHFESCDSSANPSFPPGAPSSHGACRAPGTPYECTFCGDGITQGNEQCDDGNANDHDSCRNNCTRPTTTTTTTSTTTTTRRTTTTTHTTTTTTRPTTTTTTLPRCGNGIIDSGEQCDPPGSTTCPPGSPAGAFLKCNADCTCPPPPTTTTTTTSTSTTVIVTTTTTTTIPTTTTTTVQPTTTTVVTTSTTTTLSPTTTTVTTTTTTLPRCGNGVIDSGEQCDPPGSLSCPPDSPAGAFLTCNSDCTCPTLPSTTTTTVVVSTTTTTTVPPPNHYICYNSATREANPPIVTIIDQFETARFHPRRCHPKSFCTPTAKNGSGITDPATHLKGYKIRRVTRAGEPNATVDVTNQFGTIRLRIKKAERLLVPSSKGLTGPPAPLDPQLPGNQHYKCYSITAPNFAPVSVTAADQFASRQLELRKPVSLCTPASKDGSVVKDPANHLLCYAVRPTTQPPSPVFVNNQFGNQTINLGREGSFCVPSTKIVVP